jgi:hypothetical protein
MRGATLDEPAASADAWIVRDDLLESLPCKDQRGRVGKCTTRRCAISSRVSPWDWRPVRPRLADRAAGGRAGGDSTGGDDIGFPKTATTRRGAAPVLRHAGKTANCQLGGVGQLLADASVPDGASILP